MSSCMQEEALLFETSKAYMRTLLSVPKSLFRATLELVRTGIMLGLRKQLPGMSVCTQIFRVTKSELESLKVRPYLHCGNV
jgi:hypothetical protein